MYREEIKITLKDGIEDIIFDFLFLKYSICLRHVKLNSNMYLWLTINTINDRTYRFHNADRWSRR